MMNAWKCKKIREIYLEFDGVPGGDDCGVDASDDVMVEPVVTAVTAAVATIVPLDWFCSSVKHKRIINF